MVGVAQLVERRVVVADVAGSSPVTHPTKILVELGFSRRRQVPRQLEGSRARPAALALRRFWRYRPP